MFLLNVATGLPFTVAFVVGAIVSATDPVAVVATMRDVAAPRRLATLVEAESLFNDGTGIVLFAIALAAVGAAYDPVNGVATFAVAIVSSILIGAVCGFVAVRLASVVDDHLVELTLTFVVAYGTYLIANGLGQSGVIATVVAGIILGSDAARPGSASARARRSTRSGIRRLRADRVRVPAHRPLDRDLRPRRRRRFDRLGDRGDRRRPGDRGVRDPRRPALARGPHDRASTPAARRGDDHGADLAPGPADALAGVGQIAAMPTGWFHVLFWSGLRGAVAFALVLSLPLDVPQRGVVTSTVFGIVLFTLLVQGTTAARVIAWAGVDREPAADHRSTRSAPSVAQACCASSRRRRSAVSSWKVECSMSKSARQAAAQLVEHRRRVRAGREHDVGGQDVHPRRDGPRVQVVDVGDPGRGEDVGAHVGEVDALRASPRAARPPRPAAGARSAG